MDLKKAFLISPHSLTNFEIQKYYQNKPTFYPGGDLPDKIRDGPYIINFLEVSDNGTHWIALYALNNNVTYCYSFPVKHIQKEIKKFIGDKNIQTNIVRTQDSIQ